jgi:TatA/E family protein of Tat protein translocase
MNATLQNLAFIEGIGGPELLMIMFIVLLLFGGQKLPEFAKGLGKSVREFKKAASNVEDEFKRAIEDVPDKPVAKPLPKPPANASAKESAADPAQH